MPEAKNITILGAGQWGTSLAMLAARNGCKVCLYDHEEARVELMTRERENKRYLSGFPFPEGITLTSDLKTAFANRVVMPIIPSKVYREFARKFASFVTPEHILVHGTKGLESGSHKRMSQILIEETGTKLIGALSGPNLAIEIAQQQPAATVVASPHDEVIAELQRLLASSQLRIYGNHDLTGVEWSGSFKNILAIAAGLNHGLGFGQNVLSMLITRGLTELSRLIVTMGGHSTTLLGLAGIGDIITTCTSPLSRNFRAGQMLAQGKTQDVIEKELAMTVEGFNTIRIASEVGTQKNLELPITQALEQIAFKGRPIKAAIRELMERPSTYEFDFG